SRRTPRSKPRIWAAESLLHVLAAVRYGVARAFADERRLAVRVARAECLARLGHVVEIAAEGIERLHDRRARAWVLREEIAEDGIEIFAAALHAELEGDGERGMRLGRTRGERLLPDDGEARAGEVALRRRGEEARLRVGGEPSEDGVFVRGHVDDERDTRRIVTR